MWTVVEFIESKTVEAVPTSWIYNDLCYWPRLPRDKLISDIKNNVSPSTHWPKYQIRTFKDATYGNKSKEKLFTIFHISIYFF